MTLSKRKQNKKDGEKPCACSIDVEYIKYCPSLPEKYAVALPCTLLRSSSSTSSCVDSKCFEHKPCSSLVQCGRGKGEHESGIQQEL